MDRNETIPPTTWVGIDVSKDTLDACHLPAPGGKARERAFANDAAGHAALAEWADAHAADGRRAATPAPSRPRHLSP